MVLFGPKRRLGRIEREILESITGTDLLVGFLCSARSTRAMHKIALDRARARYRTKSAIESLVTKGFADQRGDVLSITDSGRSVLENVVGTTRARLRDTEWDGKWRIVAYDIPAPYNKLRDEVRYTLKRAGFRKLHHSIWIFPHDCKELSDLIRSDRRLKSWLIYGVLESFQNDEGVRDFFNLPVH